MNLFYKNNFMVIDESFSGADFINIHKFSQILDTIKKDYDICILISHILDTIKKDYDIFILISHIDEIKNYKGKLMKINFDLKSKDSHIYIT